MPPSFQSEPQQLQIDHARLAPHATDEEALEEVEAVERHPRGFFTSHASPRSRADGGRGARLSWPSRVQTLLQPVLQSSRLEPVFGVQSLLSKKCFRDNHAGWKPIRPSGYRPGSDSKSVAFTGVGVQVPPPAPFISLDRARTALD